MGMIHCHGCGKEIHETAPMCPQCGAPQRALSSSGSSRNTGVLIIVACGWTLVLWLACLLLGGFMAGAMNPNNAAAAGEHFGEVSSIPILLISGLASGLLTTIGWLPGTKKK